MYKRSLASLICPSAPFLVPKHTTHVFHRVLQSSLSITTSRSFAIRKLAERRKESARKQAQSNYLDHLQARLHDFRKELIDGNVRVVTQLYPHVRHYLVADDSFRLAQRLHFQLRDSRDASTVNPVLEVVQLITNDYKQGNLPGHPLASVHLLSIYKEAQQYAKGHDLWSWLSKQSDEHLDGRVYGAAIELLAYSGEADLQELEGLYEHALEYYAGTFAKYHLSPNAVLPDRSQAMMTTGMPMMLVQAIITARLLLGDWQNAYLALDTALRIHPTGLAHRFFDVFCYERPFRESYKVFHMACRSSASAPPKLLTITLHKLLDENPDQSLTASRLMLHVEVLDQVIDTVSAYLGRGGELTKEPLALMVKALHNLIIFIPFEHTVDSELIKIYEQHNALIVKFAEEMVEGFIPSSGNSVNSAYHSLIYLAGKARDTDLIVRAANRIQERGDVLTIVSHRSLITALGLAGNFEAVKIAWQSISTQGTPPVWTDWIALARALGNIRDPKALEFLHEELQKFQVKPQTAASLRLECKPRYWTETSDDDLKTLNLGGVAERVKSILTKATNGKHSADEESLKTDHQLKTSFGISREELRTVYDEMSTDPQQPTPDEHVPPATDETGYPLAELRFENWLAINELLSLAEAHAREKDKAVEAAIASGRSVRNLAQRSDRSDELKRALLLEKESRSPLMQDSTDQETRSKFERAREHIRRLRRLN